MRPTVTHLLRAPIVGGSECETAAITRELAHWSHLVLYPRRFEGLGPPILERFGPSTEIRAVEDPEAELARRPTELLHVQFPFLLTDRPRGLDSVLELRRLPPPGVPTLFTVHAAVNVPIVEGVHYLFHTAEQAQAFRGRIPAERISVCPSLVPPPSRGRASEPRPDDARVRILWVSRDDDAKFHPEVAEIVRRVLDDEPGAEFRFVGRPVSFELPRHRRVVVTPCPVADLDAEYARADVFWAFPHPLVHETWGRALTEAMAHGLAAVVAAHGALPLQVEHGRSGLVADSPAACADALVRLVRDPVLRARLGAAAARRARRFFEEAKGTLARLYRRLMEERARHAASQGR